MMSSRQPVGWARQLSHVAAGYHPEVTLPSSRIVRKPLALLGRVLSKRSSCGIASARTPARPQVAVAAVAGGDVGYRYGSYSAQGLREDMEDRLVVLDRTDAEPGYIYGGIYDGHGGFNAAEWMKDNLHAYVEKNVKNGGVNTLTLSKSFKECDEELLQFLEKEGGEVRATSGSTCTVCLVQKDRVVCANVGDTSAYMLRNGGQSICLTTPHRVYGKGAAVTAEIERVKSAGGWIYDGRVCNILAVSRAFGDWEFKGKGLQFLLDGGVERGYWPTTFAAQQSFSSDPVVVTPDTSETYIMPDDEFLVVSTDGLWDVVPSAEVLRWARKQLMAGLAPAEVAQSLVELALKRKTTDNVACLVVDFKDAEYWSKQKPKVPAWVEFFQNLFHTLYYGKQE